MAALFFSRSAAAQPVEPFHLWWAEDLVTHVAPESNTYGGSPSYVRWAGVNGAAQYENRSLCTTFLTIALKQAYGWTDQDFRDWFGTPSPNAARYHGMITTEDGFDRITAVTAIEAGDILVILYPEGGSVSGHAATARGPAVLRVATGPLVPGTSQYEVPVVDSSSSGHGPTDTRRQADGWWHPGAGFGVMRIYADAQAEIVGYTWSTYTSSTYYDLSERHLAVGRLQ